MNPHAGPALRNRVGGPFSARPGETAPDVPLGEELRRLANRGCRRATTRRFPTGTTPTHYTAEPIFRDVRESVTNEERARRSPDPFGWRSFGGAGLPARLASTGHAVGREVLERGRNREAQEAHRRARQSFPAARPRV